MILNCFVLYCQFLRPNANGKRTLDFLYYIQTYIKIIKTSLVWWHSILYHHHQLSQIYLINYSNHRNHLYSVNLLCIINTKKWKSWKSSYNVLVWKNCIKLPQLYSLINDNLKKGQFQIHVLSLSFSVIKQIITEQLLKIKETFNDLSTLETAEVTATDRLNVVRLSMRARVSRQGGG